LSCLGRAGQPCWGFGRVGVSVVICKDEQSKLVVMMMMMMMIKRVRGGLRKLHQEPPGLKLTPLHPTLPTILGHLEGLRLWATLCSLSLSLPLSPPPPLPLPPPLSLSPSLVPEKCFETWTVTASLSSPLSLILCEFIRLYQLSHLFFSLSSLGSFF